MACSVPFSKVYTRLSPTLAMTRSPLFSTAATSVVPMPSICGVARGVVHDALVGAAERDHQTVGVHGLAVLLDRLLDGFRGQTRGVLARLRASHTVGHQIQADGGNHQEVVFIIAADATWVRSSVGFEHELNGL